MKKANVIPLYKKDDSSLFNNYRPVSLLSCVIFNKVFNYFHDYNLITSKQSRFMPNDSMMNQLSHLNHLFFWSNWPLKSIRVVFCDISKAFGRVWHSGHIFKLEQLGIKSPLLSWFKDYLSDRGQRVIIHGSTSMCSNISAGLYWFANGLWSIWFYFVQAPHNKPT